MKRKTPYLICIFLAFITVHMVIFEQGLGGDGWGYYAICESLLIDADLNLDNNIYGVHNGFTNDPETGRYITQYPPGLALMNAPFFLFGAMLGSVIPLHIPQERIFKKPNFSPISTAVFFRIFGFIFAHNIYTLLGLFILFLVLRLNGFGTNLSAVLVLFTYFASPLHYYAQSGMSHANSFFLISCLLFCFSKYLATRKPYFWFLIGLCIGLATTVRYTNILLMSCIVFIPFIVDSHRIKIVFYLLGGFTALFWILPVFWWVHAHQLRPSYTLEFCFNRIPFYLSLFSPHSGFFMFHPLFILCIPGMFIFLGRGYPSVSSNASLTALFSFIQLMPLCLIYGYWRLWHGGDSYSQRFLIDCLPFFTFCMTPLFTIRSKAQWIIVIFSIAATLFSYAGFLVSISRILEFPEGYIWPQYIGEYRYIFTQNHTFSDFLNGLYNNVLTLKTINTFF
ncbi:glycosyltransferase family 39 protein [bacterium]|nr:glycosyltransferase family 39 protein [bacterium]